ncbi:class I adenylate-forming enzyme family protein [Haladaptatus sp. CMSO5]|uniref:class I adenylate-forming enzyme family protein n=1 Tax=Haladaptatus sp. CMSO5 TaxID=3120514 RepID=UPI002FCE4D83
MTNWVLNFESQVHNRGHAVAIVHDGRSKTYDELNRDAGAFGNWVNRRGFEKVALFLPSMYEFLVAQLGALKAGVPVVPVNYMFGQETIGYVLTDAEADVVLTQATDAALVADVVDDTVVETVVTIGDSPHSDQTLDAILASESPMLTAAPKRDGDLFNLNYTSGTTGDPKGVYKTHRNMSAHITNMEHVWKLGPDQTWINAGPLYHTAGLESSTLPLLQAGATVVLMQWDVARFLELTERHQASSAYIVGSMLIDLANFDDPERFDTSSLRNVFCGGAPIGQADYDAVAEKYDVAASEFLGFTEAGISFTYPIGTLGAYEPTSHTSMKVPDSCGRPLFNQVEVRLCDPDTDEVVTVIQPDGETTPGRGELQLRGESVFEKYYRKPEQTANAFTEDGWYRTGDVVSVDEAGYVYYQDRADNMLVTGGENVYPRAIEPVVNTHPSVHESAVFGLPHERWGTQICVAVVPKKSADLTEAAIIDFCKASDALADYEVPKRVYVRETIPKTPTNSIRRRALTEEYSTQAEQ